MQRKIRNLRPFTRQKWTAFKKRVVEDEEFAAKYADLGPVYGKQWRSWTTGDRLDRSNRQSNRRHKKQSRFRRHIVTAWNPSEVEDMALPPCHAMFQFYVSDGKLSCQLYQRSADIFLGVPFNIASYALTCSFNCKRVGLEVGEFVHTLGDAHIYSNHIDQVNEQLSREPKKLPTLKLRSKGNQFLNWKRSDIHH